MAGKQVADTPKVLLKSEISYDNGAFFVHADVNHTGERYYTYLNDGGVHAYTLLNSGIGLPVPKISHARATVPQADATNLTDETYFSTIDSNGFVASDMNGTTQTLCSARRGSSSALKAHF